MNPFVIAVAPKGARRTELAVFVAEHRSTAPWFVCAFGGTEHACAVEAAVAGGHARVGFENNLVLVDGRIAPSNAALVAQLAEDVRRAGRAVATHAEAVTVLGAG